jgi:hypothetical protein
MERIGSSRCIREAAEMSLTALEMKRLEGDARDIASESCRGYLSDALQCLQDTGDPVAAIELLRAMWGTGHAKRPYQKDALADAGGWLEERLGRDPGISRERLALELGWLRRLVVVHGGRDGADRDRDGSSSSHRDAHGRGREESPFGAHAAQLRRRRELALARAAQEASSARGAGPAHKADSPPPPRPERLPDSFEVCFVSWEQALETFKAARKRRKDKKPPKDRLLSVQPVAAELRPLAVALECSMLETEGMAELQERTVARGGDPPSFWIATADLIEREGKRIPRRISFEAP